MAFAPGIRAHAAANCLTSQPKGFAVNPITTQVSGDYGAQSDQSRLYGEISGSGTVCVNPAAASLSTVKGTVEEASFTITLSGGIPNFAAGPSAAGDVGMELNACVDMNNGTGLLGDHIVQIGTGHRGGPVFDGPYPASQGYKYCAWASKQTGVPDDWGWAVFTPEGIFNQTSHLNAHDTSGNSTISAPVGWTTGSTSVTLYLPYAAVYQVNAIAPPFKGLPHNYVEPYLAAPGVTSTTLSNIVDEAQVTAEASLPMPICVNTNPAGITCNGNETVGPVQGIVGLLVTTSWAPGHIICASVNPLTCAASDGSDGTHNGVDLGIVEVPPGVPGVGLVGQAIATCANPLLPGPPEPPTNNPLVTCAEINGTYTYAPCQTTSTQDGQDQGDLTIATGSCPVAVGPQSLPYEYDTEYGRIYGYTLGKVPATGFYLEPTFLPSGWGA